MGAIAGKSAFLLGKLKDERLISTYQRKIHSVRGSGSGLHYRIRDRRDDDQEGQEGQVPTFNKFLLHRKSIRLMIDSKSFMMIIVFLL
jgi:hypothetical protein